MLLTYKDSKKIKITLLVVSISLLTACSSSSDGDDDDEVDPFTSFSALPQSVTHPIDNQPNTSKTELGRLLFWDPILSGGQDVACATCHHPSLGFAENIQLSKGVGGMGLGEDRIGGSLVKRNASTVVNTAFNGFTLGHDVAPELAPMFWDNRTESLENQALLPILSEEEMRGSDIDVDDIFDVIVTRIESIPLYVDMFEAAFGDDEINEQRIGMAIASFERTIIANNSPFDAYMRGDESALNEEEIEGMELFLEAGCAECHSGPMLSNYELHVIGVPESDDSELLPEYDRGAGNFEFRTPTLRNLSSTAPYMHNGAFDSLEQVISFYFDAAEGEDIHPELALADLDPNIRDLELDDDEDEGDEDEFEEDENEEEEAEGDLNEDLAALVSFLRTLDDNSFDQTVPSTVPSGLNPGGFIE